MGCRESREEPNNAPINPISNPDKILEPEKEAQPPVIAKQEAQSPDATKSGVQASIGNDAEVQPSATTEPVEQPDIAKSRAEDEKEKVDTTTELVAVQTKAENDEDEVVVDAKREPEINYGKVDLEKQAAQVQAVENEAESDSKKSSTEQKVKESNATTATKAVKDQLNPTTESNPALVSADADSADSDTEAEAKDNGPPLLTIDGENIRRHSDTTKKLFQQLANSDGSRIEKKDFMQYFRNQGASNLTSRRLYSKFNPENTPSMTFDQFQVNLLANTVKEG